MHLLFFHKTTNKYQNRKNQTTCLRVLFHLHFINLLVNSIIVWITESATQQQISKADMHGITDNESESFVISSSSQVVVPLIYAYTKKSKKEFKQWQLICEIYKSNTIIRKFVGADDDKKNLLMTSLL